MSFSGSTVAKPDMRTDARNLSLLAIGMTTMHEHTGGLNRMFFGLQSHLNDVGVCSRGLVAGTVQDRGAGQTRLFARPDAGLLSNMLAARRAVRNALAERSPDVVASHFAPYAFAALDLIRGVPRVVHFHGPWAQESRQEGQNEVAVRIKRAVEGTVYRGADRFVVLSGAFGRILVDGYGVPAERLRIVPGGVDADHFAVPETRLEARERLGLASDRPIVLTVRRLVKRMGLENLLIAFDGVRRAVPDALLVIAGQGPLKEQLESQVEELHLDRHVTLLGFVPEESLPLLYRSANVTVVPSLALEGFGLVTVESLAAGTPVLVTPVGGLPEAVADLDPSLILPAATGGALREGLVAALTEAIRMPSEAACRAYARSRYSWPVIARLTRSVYEEALE